MDTHGKTILVAGATGNQGGATVRHLLADGWYVRALIRDDTTPAAAAPAAAGAELVGDLDDRASYDAAVRGAYGVYSVQSANDNQAAQGKNLADAAKAAEVRHLVYSSVGGVESQNRFYLEQGWGPIDKWRIEEHIRDLGVPATILRPAGFMEDFTSPSGSCSTTAEGPLPRTQAALGHVPTIALAGAAQPHNPDQSLGHDPALPGGNVGQLADGCLGAAIARADRQPGTPDATGSAAAANAGPPEPAGAPAAVGRRPRLVAVDDHDVEGQHRPQPRSDPAAPCPDGHH